MKGRTASLRDHWPAFILGLLAAPVLLLAHRQNPALSHNVLETFSVVVAFGIFMLTWNARILIDNHYFIYLGISCLFVGSIDYLHALTFDGVFTAEGHTHSIELWFSARFLQGAALVTAPLFTVRKVRPWPALAGFAAVSVVLVSAAFLGLFPDYYIPGKGLTRAKSVSDFLFAGLLSLSVWTLWRVRAHFDPEVFRRLVLSILFAIAAELSAGVYTDTFVYNSMIGHSLKVVSYYLVYKAVIATGLIRPYGLLFRNLKRSEEEVRAARDGLEARVAERTAEIREANILLERELADRVRAEEMRDLILDLVHRTQSVGSVRDFLSALTSFLRDRFPFEAIGVRYRRGVDYPYFEIRGFSEEFVAAETTLCSPDRSASGGDTGGGEPHLDCVCGAVIAGRCDPSLPFFTPNGTFWTNSASDLLATDGFIRTIATRGRCVKEGYESIVLVPLRSGDATLALLQLNDRRKGMIRPHQLAQLERIAENAAGVLARLIAQEALMESEERLRSLAENVLVGAMIVQEGLVVSWNPEQERILGPIDPGCDFRRLGKVHPDDASKFERFCDIVRDREPFRQGMELRFILPSGPEGGPAQRWLHCLAVPIDFRGKRSSFINMVDITRVKDLERIDAVRDKLASLGQLAAGIAHEIRNPLSGVIVNVASLDLLCRRAQGLEPEEMEKIRKVVFQARAASEKISLVIKRIMDFTRPVPPRLDRIDINRVVRGALSLTEIASRKGGVEFRERFSTEPLFCQADPALLEQVLLNLGTNAFQAMERGGREKVLTVSTTREGPRAVIRIGDTGPGVPEHLREKIFEPFYTTRMDGHGIGLSFSHRVVSDLGGRLFVGASEAGGAEFRVELPLQQERGTA